jgi:hypothetical protein
MKKKTLLFLKEMKRKAETVILLIKFLNLYSCIPSYDLKK